MKRVALSDIKDQLSKYLKLAQKDRVLITRHGKPAGILIGFKDEDDWFDYQLENDPRFLERVEKARKSLGEGKGVRLEDIESDA
jgi:prevent-host-death family protein